MDNSPVLSLEPLPESHRTGLTCPCCGAPMQEHRFPRKLRGEVVLDLCFSCQCLWFDEFESLQLAPAGVLELFQLIHRHQDEPRHPWPGTLRCPRCQDQIIASMDICKSGRFPYHRCLQKHGHLIAFAAFMIEKGFIRQLNPAEIRELAQKVQTIRCSGCGAPVDIGHESVCSQCRAPIAILDPHAIDKALAGFSQAATPKSVDPLAFADALIANERLKSQAQKDKRNSGHDFSLAGAGDTADLVAAGLEFFLDVLSDR